MIIRWDTAAYTLVKEFAADQFRPGPRMFRLADDMVGYSTTGGFIDDLVPTIEDLKARIIAGEIIVPERPST
jgi:basic membrane protein A